MSPEIAVYVWAIVLRLGQAMIYAAPYLLIGLLIAGALRAMVGTHATRAMFAGNAWTAAFRAAAWGFLLPVCSLGVLPILRELKRVGVAPGALVTFAIVGATLNPLSIIYGLTAMPVWFLLAICGGTVAAAVLAGVACQFLATRQGWLPPELSDALPAATPGRRLGGTVLLAARDLTGPMLLDLAIAAVGISLLIGLNPPDTLRDSLSYESALSAPLLALAAPWAHVAPDQAMMLVGSMFDVQNAHGAALVLMVLGGGLNLAVIVWLLRKCGGRAALGGLAVLLIAVFALGYSYDALLDHPVSGDEDTHGLDILSRMFKDPNTQWAYVKIGWHKTLRSHHGWSLGALAVLALVGAVARITNINQTIETWFPAENESPAATTASISDRWTKLLVGSLALLFIGVATYVYYPAPQMLLDDMRVLKAEVFAALASGDDELALAKTAKWESLAGKLPVGAMIRGEDGDCVMRDAAARLRRVLPELRAAIADGRTEQAKTLLDEAMEIYNHCQLANGSD